VSGGVPGPPGHDVADRALSLAVEGSSGAAGELVTMAQGRRRPLEDARHLLTDRLHHRSDDFAATRALRLVSAALNRIGWEGPDVVSRALRRDPLAMLWPWSGRRTHAHPRAGFGKLRLSRDLAGVRLASGAAPSGQLVPAASGPVR
jgi:hypothetical protein